LGGFAKRNGSSAVAFFYIPNELLQEDGHSSSLHAFSIIDQKARFFPLYLLM
jgi:hypothetical protein